MRPLSLYAASDFAQPPIRDISHKHLLRSWTHPAVAAKLWLPGRRKVACRGSGGAAARPILRHYILDAVLWAQHILERYRHSVRNFGLFAPHAVGETSAAIFALLQQEKRPRPKPRPWALARKQDFGHDPLLDSHGERMKLVRFLPPSSEKN